MARLGLLALAVSVSAGCIYTGKRKDPNAKKGSSTAAATSSTTGATTSAGNGVTPLTAGAAATQPLAVQRAESGAVVGLAFSLSAGAEDLTIRSLEVSSRGTVDETKLGQARWYEDKNGNGQVDPGEPELATSQIAAADDDPYGFFPMPPVKVAKGTTVNYLIALDTSQMKQDEQVAAVGETVELAVDDATKVQAEDPNGQPASAGGSFPVSSSATLEFGEHVLISEIVTGPGSGATSAEYVELFNPTAQPIDLETYYLSDFSDDPVNGRFYWKLPRGEDCGPAFSDPGYDFLVRFPKGAQLKPGQVITVAIDGEGYKAAYKAEADFCMRNAGATASTQMLTWNGQVGKVDFADDPVSDDVGLTNSSEFVSLFRWDGESDLVQDVDIVLYGTGTTGVMDKSPNQAAPGPDVRLDSLFDKDNVASTYKDDSSEAFQRDHRAPSGTAIQRVDFSEGNEVKTGGNGITGNDETSENCGDGAGGKGTFQSSQTPTPGTLK
ncbi:MAG: lamin tail domain-containing protein [Planctomycetota bacterium]